jgi:ABC-type antimicrobial peptide transport system permease subunit
MPEFGVRLALGCAGADLWRRVILDQLQVVLTGAAFGAGLAAIASRLLASLLPETARFDAAVVGGAVALIVVTATVAAAIPASRVLRLNPLAILRQT